MMNDGDTVLSEAICISKLGQVTTQKSAAE